LGTRRSNLLSRRTSGIPEAGPALVRRSQPIIQRFTDDDVKTRAYYIWEKKGRKPDQSKEEQDKDYYEARQQLEKEEKTQTASGGGGPKLNDVARDILTADDKIFLAKLPSREQFEAWLQTHKANEKREILGMWDSSGRLTHVNVGGVAKTGEPPAVELPGKRLPAEEGLAAPVSPDHESIEVRRNTVVTHTHPSGSALSKGDIAAAIDGDVAEMRSVGKFGTYSLRRPATGWPKDLADKAKLEKYLNILYRMTGPAAWADYAKTLGEERPKNEKRKGAATSENTKASAIYQIANWRPKNEAALLIGTTFAEDMFMEKHFANLALESVSPERSRRPQVWSI
jgi:hypothetical protein